MAYWRHQVARHSRIPGLRSRSSLAMAERIVTADAVAADVAAEIDHVEPDALPLHLLQRAERVGGGPEHAIKLGCDHRIAGLDGRQQFAALRSIGERHRSETPASTNTSATSQPFIMA